MPKHVEHLKIFLASPGDVQLERDQARRVIEEINRTIGRDKNVHLDVFGWETDAYPGYGGDGQSLVNSQIAEMAGYDLFLGIMWNRFGQPTPRAASGTEEEFNLAADSYERTGQPEIMLYFNQAPANLSTSEQLGQKAKVIEFKGRVRDRALTWDYAGTDSFQPLLQRHLSQWVLNSRHETPKAPTPAAALPDATGRAAAGAPTRESEDTWILLGETFYVADSVKTQADGGITLRIRPRDAEEEAHLRSLNPRQYGGAGTVPYAYQNDGGSVQVKNVEAESEGGQTVFIVRLQMMDSWQGGLMEANVNGVSADEIAVMRARLLLLNEFPPAQRPNDPLSIMHFVSGLQAGAKVERGIFPDFWKHMQGQPGLFVPLARLLAVHNLKASNTVEHVLELSLGPVKNGALPVSFRGQRKRAYVNSAPAVIEVQGECRLA